MKNKKISDGAMGLTVLITSQVIFSIAIFYWKQIHTDPLQTLCNRMLWSWVFALICVIFFDKERTCKKVFADRKKLFSFLAAGLLLSVNWGTYLYCVNTANIVESSLGYFINPLLLCIAGIVIYKEKMTVYNISALILGFLGVLYMTINYGKPPVLALLLAGTYAVYSIIKRNCPAKPYVSMFIETTAMLPMALIYFFYLIANGESVFLNLGSSNQPWWLLLAGIVTLSPLMLYAVGIGKASMVMVGFTSFISPVLSLLIGVFCYGEAFTLTHAISFSLVWIGVVIFSAGNVIEHRKKKKQERV